MEPKLTKVMVIYFMNRIEYNSFIWMVTSQSKYNSNEGKKFDNNDFQ